MRLPISSQTPETLRTWLDERGEKPYRASQILKWVHQHFAVDWAAMTNLGESLQISLAESFNFSTVELARKQGDADTTQKFLWKLRAQRSPHVMHLHASGLRVRLHFLRQRIGRIQAQPRTRRNHRPSACGRTRAGQGRATRHQ